MDIEVLRRAPLFATLDDEAFRLLTDELTEVDLSRGVITVINTKSARDRVVPINARARAEFEALRSLPKLNEYVFRSPRTGGQLKWIKRAWGATCREAGLAGFRFHDLRHTAATSGLFDK